MTTATIAKALPFDAAPGGVFPQIMPAPFRIIFDPTAGSQLGNIYVTWAAAYQCAQLFQGPKVIRIQNGGHIPTAVGQPGNYWDPLGVWSLEIDSSTIILDEGATFNPANPPVEIYYEGNRAHGTLQSNATATVPFNSTAVGFTGTQLTNLILVGGSVSMFTYNGPLFLVGTIITSMAGGTQALMESSGSSILMYESTKGNTSSTTTGVRSISNTFIYAGNGAIIAPNSIVNSGAQMLEAEPAANVSTIQPLVVGGTSVTYLNSQPGQIVIFNTAGSNEGNVYTTFLAACDEAATFQGITTIYCIGTATIPAATYNAGSTWILELAPGAAIALAEGVQFTTPPLQVLNRGGVGFLQSHATATTPFKSTGSDNCLVANLIIVSGSVPLFDWSASSGALTFYGVGFGGAAVCVFAKTMVVGRSKYGSGVSQISATTQLEIASGGTLTVLEETIISANTITATTYTFNADISCSIAPAQSGVPGGVLVINWLNFQPLNTLTYTPATPANWAGGVNNMQAATDRLAAAVEGLLGHAIP